MRPVFYPQPERLPHKLRLLDGDPAAAQEWLDCYYVNETDHIEFFRSFQHFTTARAYIATGEAEYALKYLFMLKEFGENLNRPLDLCEAGVLLTAYYWAQGRKKEAVEELKETLAVLQPYGFIRIVADEGAAILPALKRVMSKISETDYSGPLTRTYVNEVLLAAHIFAQSHKGYMSVIGNGKNGKSVKLSKQQAKMITLLSQGYKNAEIAEMTGLSIPTIKTHTSIAYKKLGVNNAMDAVLKARELGLVK